MNYYPPIRFHDHGNLVSHMKLSAKFPNGPDSLQLHIPIPRRRILALKLILLCRYF